MKGYKKYSIVFSISIFIVTIVYTQNIEKEDLIKKRQEIEKEIEFTNKLLNDTRSKKSNSFQEFKLLKSKINSRNKLISELNNDIKNTEREIHEKSNKLQSLKKDLEKSRSEYAALIYYAFKNSNANLNFMYLLASENISQFYSRYVYLQQYKEYRLEQIELIKRLKMLIENNINELLIQKQEMVNTINRNLAEKALLVNDQSEISQVIERLKQQEEELLKQIEEKKRLARKLDKEIADLIKKEASKSKYELLTPADRIISNEFASNKGRLPWPTERGIITDHFGEHDHPVIKNLKIRNNGIDIATVTNSKARAVFNGEVSKVFTIKGANTTVIIRHGNYYTVYHNLKNVKVKAGDIVLTKDYIGDIYTDSYNSQTIIHFEVWKELEKQNPEDWLSN